jgi:transcriptional regulator with XRE-family HTH domain
MATLGEVIRQRRMELGMTQEDLAELIGDSMRQPEISRLERDEVGLPRRYRLEAIANALDLPIGELLVRSGWTGAGSIDDGDDEAGQAEIREEIRSLESSREAYRAEVERLHREQNRQASLLGQLEATLDGVEDAVVVISVDGDIVYHNMAWDTIMRRHGAEISLRDNHGNEITADLHPFQRAARGEEFSLDLLAHGGGTSARYTAHGKPIVTDADEHLGVVTIQDCEDNE